MANMADRIKRSNQTTTSDEKAARENASHKEHSKANLPTSFRLPPDTLSQLEELRIARGQESGRIPTATEIVKSLIAEAHKKEVR